MKSGEVINAREVIDIVLDSQFESVYDMGFYSHDSDAYVWQFHEQRFAERRVYGRNL